MGRRKRIKMAAPALPKQFLPKFDVADVELVEDKQVFTVRASFGDITSFGKGFRKKKAKRAAVQAIFQSGLARLRNKRMVVNSGLYTSFGNKISKKGPTKVFAAPIYEVIDLTIGSPKPEKDELKEVIDVTKDDCEDLTIELPKQDKGRFKGLIKVSNNDCHGLTIDLPRQTGATMKKLIDEQKDTFHDFTEGFSRPADGEPKEIIEVKDDEIIDLTVDSKTSKRLSVK